MTTGPGGKEHWGSRIGVILAVMGSAVGLGNFLRFPGLLAKYEGAFMIPYIIALLILGLPLAWCEWSMGRYAGSQGFNSPPGIFRLVWKNRIAPYIGALSAMVPIVIYCYYIHVEAWCLQFAWMYLSGDYITQTQQQLQASGVITPDAAGQLPSIGPVVMESVSGMSADGSIFTSSAVLFLLLAFMINFSLIYRGVVKGIEWCNRIAMPALVVCALIVLARVMTLSPPEYAPEQTVMAGLGQMWNPDWKALTNAEMWVDATGQVFFTLSLGFGLILTYASYVRRNEDIALSATTAIAGNEFCEVVLAALAIVPAAFMFLGPAIIGKVGLGLGFFALPSVFQEMPMGRLIGFLFFFLLFLAAITSSLSMLQPAIALLEEGLGLKRKASVTLLGFISLTGALLVGYFSKGLQVIDVIDFWVGNFMLFVLATIMVIVYAWAFGVDKGYSEIMHGSSIRVPQIVKPIIKYVAPGYLLIVMCCWLYQNGIAADEGGVGRIRQIFIFEGDGWRNSASLGFIAFMGMVFMVLTAISVRRWDRREQLSREASR